MIYILDAYNVIHKIPRLEAKLDRDLRAAREALVLLAAGFIARRGDIRRIILVFDGRSEFRDLPQAAPAGIEMIFSETGEKADERIVKILEALKGEARKCVVSDDNFVRNHARAYHARMMPVAEFERSLAPSGGKRTGRAPDLPGEKVTLPAAVAGDITEAYKKHLGL